MTLRSFRNKRDASEPAIVKALEAMGCSVVRVDKPYDLVIGYRGHMWWGEVKTPGTAYGRGLNKNQAEFQKTWNGLAILILTEPEQAVRLVNNSVSAWSKKA